jgi:hypothetical protein
VLSLEFLYAEETALVIVLLLIGVLYSGLIPLMLPLLAAGMLCTYACKRTIVVKYSVKVPADESLNSTVINVIPFIILLHALFSLWGHTSAGVFAAGSPLLSLSVSFSQSLDRIFSDVLMLGEVAVILVVIVVDFTVVTFLGWLGECCCKDELEVPV